MVCTIMPTPRDTSLLYDCYRNVVLSFSQIHTRHFEKIAKQTVSNRLTKLIQTGFLERHRVGLYLHHGKPKTIGTVFQIARRGIQYLRSQYPTEPFREDPVRLNPLTLYHDVLLTEVVDALSCRFPHAKFAHGRLWSPGRIERRRIPDAVILSQSGEADVAIELELTVKSESRYLEIVNQYQHQSTLKKVLYVVEGESMADKIRLQIVGRRMLPGEPPPDTERFYFVTLSALLRDPRHAPISNGSCELAVI
jgi:hypothetical protein